MIFEAILWDNDGVLVDTEELYYRATKETLATVGVDLTERAYVDLLLVEGRGAWHLAEERGLAPGQLEDLKASRDARYETLLALEDVLLEGVPETLLALRPHFRMAVVTSTKQAHFDIVHRRLTISSHFEFILTREHYQKAKPDPEPYLSAVERLRLPRERCLVVEDSERGLRAAKAAGLTCWVVPRGLSRHGCFAMADRVFGSVSEIARELLRSVPRGGG